MLDTVDQEPLHEDVVRAVVVSDDLQDRRGSVHVREIDLGGRDAR